jgi:hypothetical protein
MVLFPSCTNDLIQSPDSGDQISGDQFFNTESYKQNLAIIRGFATTGQQGPAGQDISGIDEGENQYIRGIGYYRN